MDHQLEANVALYDKVNEANRAYYLYKQVLEDSNVMHLKNYRTDVDVVNHFGNNLFNNDALARHEKEKGGGLVSLTEIIIEW